MATVTLYTDYPFVQGGGHMPYFASSAERDNFFNTLKSQSLPTDFQPRQGARLLVSLTFLEAQKYNYCIWTDGTQKLYFFIEDYLYLNDKTTQLIISRDIWNDNQLRAVANPCNVHRMHMPRWEGSEPVIYPITEGNPSYVYAESSQSLRTFGNMVIPVLIVTNKELETEAHADGIFYYMSLASIYDNALINRYGGGYFMNPFSSDFVDQFQRWGIGLSVIVGGYITQITGDLVQQPATSVYRFSSEYGREVSVSEGDTALYYMFRMTGTPLGENIASPTKSTPTRNTSATAQFQPEYEPMCYADNLRPCVITDALGYPVLDVPKGVYLKSDFELNAHTDFRALSPTMTLWVNSNSASIRGGSPADGLEAFVSCVPIDIPQSSYYDWVGQAKAQEKTILENNIRSRYIQTAVSGAAGIAGGGAASYGYAQAYGGKNAVAGKAGIAGAASGVAALAGSLINSYVQAQTDRDNFKLNEQKIKNTPTPPITGNNPFILDGPKMISLRCDEPTLQAVAGQYHYYGYILDRAMPISLKPNRYYWMYLQTKDANITGEVNQDDRNYIASLLNRGLTIWNMNHWVGFGAYQYDNVEY